MVLSFSISIQVGEEGACVLVRRLDGDPCWSLLRSLVGTVWGIRIWLEASGGPVIPQSPPQF